MKFPKFWNQTPNGRNPADVLAEINKVGDDAFIRKTDPKLADDLAKGIANTQEMLKNMNIPMGNPARIGDHINIPNNLTN